MRENHLKHIPHLEEDIIDDLPDVSRPVLARPEIELSDNHAQIEQQLENLLVMGASKRAQLLAELEDIMTEIYNEPIRKGSDRWVFVTQHVVYKIPSPQSFGSGQAGIFASLQEGNSQDPSLAVREVVYTPQGIPIVIMERLEIEHDDIEGDSQGINAQGQTVKFDGGSISY